MAKFSRRSLERLSTCHPDLQHIAHEAIKEIDFTVLCGHRTEEEQQQCFDNRTSKLKWPNSKHNSLPSRAMDLAPYPLDWEDEEAFEALADVILRVADELEIDIVWGGEWKMRDLPHFELT